MKMHPRFSHKIQLTFFAALLATALGACGHEDHSGHDHDHDPAHEHGEKAEAPGEHHDGHITFSAEQAMSAGLETEVVAPGPFREVIRTSGEILAAPGDERVVSAKAAGMVSFSVAGLNTGTPVRAGQTLFTVSSRGMADADGAAAARVAAEAARKEYERAADLLKDRIISQKEFDRAKADYEAARAVASGAANSAATGSVGAASPISGYVVSLDVRPGQYVAAGEPLATVSQTHRLQLKGNLPERHAARLGEITGANFVVPHTGAVVQLEQHGGRVATASRTADSNRNLPVFFDFDNPGGALSNGMIVETYLLGMPRQDVISVPKRALTEEQGSYYVYLQEGPETYHKQIVTTGASDGARVEILSGLEKGDKVVTTGAYNVKMAGNTGAIPAHSHSH